MNKKTLDQLTADDSRIALFEQAYTLDADDAQRSVVLQWMRGWQQKNGYAHSSLQDHYIGFCLALSTHISIQEAWEAAGGNPGIKATKEELISALRLLDEVCDEADDTPVIHTPKVTPTHPPKRPRGASASTMEKLGVSPKTEKVRKAPKVDAGERMRKLASAPKKAQETTQEMGKKIREMRKAMNLNQMDFGEYIGLSQTEVSALERGLVTKRSDGGASAIERSKRFLESVRKLYANKDAPLVITAKAPDYMSGESSHQTHEHPIQFTAIGTREGPQIADTLVTVVPEKKELGNITTHVNKPRTAHERNISMAFHSEGSWINPKQAEDPRYDSSDIKAAQLLQSNFRLEINAADFDQLNDAEREQAMRVSTENAARLSFDDKDAIIWSDFKTFVDTHHGKRLPRSANIDVGPIRLYVRAGMCFYFDGDRRNAIEISRIDISEELQGRGLAKHFFKELTRFAASRGIKYLVVAQVHNENFREQLEAWGYTRYHQPGNEEDFIYIKVLF